MASILTRNLPSPSFREKVLKLDNMERDSPFTEILLELAGEENNDQIFGVLTGSAARNYENSNPNWGQMNQSAAKTKKDVNIMHHKDPKDPVVSSTSVDIRSVSLGPIEIQAREYLSETIVHLSQRIASSQMQLQVLSLQLQHDLPAFVARAMQLFSDNNQHLLETTSDNPSLFYLEQKEFVDQAVSIYLQQFLPTHPAPAFNDAMTANHNTWTPSDQMKCRHTTQTPPTCSAPDFMEWMTFNDPQEAFEFDAQNEFSMCITKLDADGPGSVTTTFNDESSSNSIPFTARKRVCFRMGGSSNLHNPVSPSETRKHQRISSSSDNGIAKIPTCKV